MYIHILDTKYCTIIHGKIQRGKENNKGERKIEMGWKEKREEREVDTLSFVPSLINY
jgi:hypothetical protein